jgi:hypothetical protein
MFEGAIPPREVDFPGGFVIHRYAGKQESIT